MLSNTQRPHTHTLFMYCIYVHTYTYKLYKYVCTYVYIVMDTHSVSLVPPLLTYVHFCRAKVMVMVMVMTTAMLLFMAGMAEKRFSMSSRH